MDLIGLLIVVLILGVIWYVVDVLLPLPEPFKLVAKIVMALILVLYLLGQLGVGPTLMLHR